MWRQGQGGYSARLGLSAPGLPGACTPRPFAPPLGACALRSPPPPAAAVAYIMHEGLFVILCDIHASPALIRGPR